MLDELKWFAAYTKPRSEKRVAERLEKRGISYYLPLLKQLKQWSDRKKWVEEPAFKSYIFIQSTINNLPKAVATEGVLHIIQFSGKPQVVPNDQIENLRLLLNNPDLIEIKDELVTGDDIEITSGPLAGIRGKIIDGTSPKNLAVNIDILGRSIHAQVPVFALKKIPKTS